MKKLISIILCTIMLIALAACGKSVHPGETSVLPNNDAGQIHPLTADPTPAPSVTPTSEPTADPDAVAYPQKPEMSAEDQAIADRYYEELKEVFPEFYAIPRELVYETVFVDSDGDITVRYVFCLGGYMTDYRCCFSKSAESDEGDWTVYGEEFAQFSDRVLNAGQVASIKGMLFDSISAVINEKHLEKGDLNADDIGFCWMLHEGKLMALWEVIASVGPDTEETFGCIGHAHVIGRVQVEFTEGGIELTDLGALGG